MEFSYLGTHNKISISVHKEFKILLLRIHKIKNSLITWFLILDVVRLGLKFPILIGYSK